MNTFIVFACLVAVGVAYPQFGGGSAGGLVGHYEPLRTFVIGLSRGQEEEKKGGGGGGGGEGGQGGGEKKEGEGGFGGSYFGTPVDIHKEEAIHLKAYPEFHYDYHVADHKTKDYKSKHEVRDGYKVKGSYSLLEPDHKTIRIVDYESDKKQGFIAKVSYKKHE